MNFSKLAEYQIGLIAEQIRNEMIKRYGDKINLIENNLLKEILKMFTRDTDLILDPFIGSGSTAMACLQLNRRFIGFEIEEKYYKIALERVQKALG